MAKAEMRFPDVFLETIKKLTNLEKSKLDELFDRFLELEGNLSLEQINSKIQQSFKNEELDINKTVNFILAMVGLPKDVNLPIDEIIETLHYTFTKAGSIANEENYKNFEKKLKLLFEKKSNSISLIRESRRSLSATGNILREAQLFVDLRSIDSTGFDNINLVLYYTLRVLFDGNRRDMSINFSLDKNDLKSLKVEIERVLEISAQIDADKINIIDSSKIE